MRSPSGQHAAPVVDRDEPASGQRRRQRAGQAGVIGQGAQGHRSGVRDDPTAGDFNAQIPGPPGKLVHLESAPCLWFGYGVDHHILPGQRALFCVSITSKQDRYEYLRLAAGRLVRSTGKSH